MSASSPSDAAPAEARVPAALVRLVMAPDRMVAAHELAAALGCRELLIFIQDRDLGVSLPAPGFPRTLPDGRRWREMLRECTPGVMLRRRQILPGRREPEDVVALAAEDGTVLVVAGDRVDTAGLDIVALLLPVVAAALRGEQEAETARAQALLAEQHAARAESLALALDGARQELQQALARADEALHLRDEFLAVAAHELKTPLTVLSLQAQMVRRKLRPLLGPSPLGEEIGRLMDPFDRSLRRLMHLTGDLLDVTRIQAGHFDLQLEQVDLADLAREVVGRFEDDAVTHGSHLTVDAPEPVTGRWDASRLDQVLTNLVSNALTYGKGEPVTVSVRQQGQTARIGVQDRGPGIAFGDQERVFNRFERALLRADGGGLGLGLHITREIVHAHGGKISVSSIPGEGATFIVELPDGR